MAGVQRRPGFSALSRRIILFNAFALVVLIAGVIAVQANRVGLVDERLSGIQEQAQIVASTLAEYTTDEDTHGIQVNQAKPLLRQLIAPTRLRARLYDTTGRLLIDTRYILARNVVQVQDLPPIDWWHRFNAEASRIYDGVMGVRPLSSLAPYFEAGENGRVYGEVTTALSGDIATAERVDQLNKLVLSVAIPIQRFKAIYGVLLVSTEGGDIDDILREERATLIQVFLVAVGVMVVSSLFLARFIADPVQRLARAADEVRGGHTGRATIPRMEERQDEIGDLASSLSAMTRALYDRIDAIERFAADVAHELKNPLTSLNPVLTIGTLCLVILGGAIQCRGPIRFAGWQVTWRHRRGRESNPRIEVLQTPTLPLGYPAEIANRSVGARFGGVNAAQLHDTLNVEP